ncbi:MAG TPA: prepilin-type N-terminal cleavage/methylation domain-containing protein [Armatimonadota bacterium]|jgi:type II secretion system protein J
MSGLRRGFTLIEVMVASVIFMLFISSVYGVYRAANQSMAHAEAQEDLYQTGRVLLAQINAELTCAYQPATDTTSELLGTDSTTSASDALQQDQLAFLTTGHVVGSDEVAGDVTRVTYLMVGEGQDTQPGLYIEESLHPGLEMSDEEPAKRLLSPLVVGFNCKYLPASGDWLTEWQGQTTLPRAVRIELTLQSKQRGAKPLVLVTTANLTMATAPASTTEGGADAQ